MSVKTIINVSEKDIDMESVISKATSNQPVNIEEVAAVARILEDQATIYKNMAATLTAGLAGKDIKAIKADLIARGLMAASDADGDIIVAVTPATGEDPFGIKIKPTEVTTVKVSDVLKKADDATLKLLPKEMIRTETKLVTDSALIALVDAGKIPDIYKSEISVSRTTEIKLSKAKI